ncbi:LysR substrate-binding domain-containing protein [Pseudidiomarina atlantica]|uniref:LysR substrate-binding domain-containing protein n=1 Tax=Pseudidiomarina atlantica TaxID=1517416 RepID=UPI00054F1471|nr:LysR substrate-binding domain-containing protein [Pseudidiomarina atlantica]
MTIPFRSIHYFSEVARLGSFSKAAERLFVTQSAVSHQVKILEEYLGHELFVRRGRQLLLSAVGRSYYDKINSPIETIQLATRGIKSGTDGRLRLALFGSLAVKWLIPAIDEFRQRFPNVDLSLQILTQDGEFDTAKADCFITTKPPKTGFVIWHLYDETLRPYCAPALWSELRDLEDQTQIANYPLLSAASTFASQEPGKDWQVWFETFGSKIPAHTKIHHFSHLLLASEAAKYGQGIALLNEFMTTARERESELFELPFNSIKTDDSFYFIYPEAYARNPSHEALTDWLISLCKGHRAPIEPTYDD